MQPFNHRLPTASHARPLEAWAVAVWATAELPVTARQYDTYHQYEYISCYKTAATLITASYAFVILPGYVPGDVGGCVVGRRRRTPGPAQRAGSH